jgi:alpha-1,6-mannosyltransferase
MIFANFAGTALYTYVSMENYPGGASLVQFNEHYKTVDNGVPPSILPLESLAELPPVHVHLSNLAAQTGASLFLQTHSAPYYSSLSTPSSELNWVYNKTENIASYSQSQFTHLIVEATNPVPRGWKKVDCIEGFDRWSLNSDVLLKRGTGSSDWGTLLSVSRVLLTRETSDKLCILERS